MVVCVADATTADADIQSNVVAGTETEDSGRQSRSLSIIARALGKGLDVRRPSTVAAVFSAATTRLSRRPSSSVRAPDDDLGGGTRPRRPTGGGGVTWKDSDVSERRTNSTDITTSVEQAAGEELDH